MAGLSTATTIQANKLCIGCIAFDDSAADKLEVKERVSKALNLTTDCFFNRSIQKHS